MTGANNMGKRKLNAAKQPKAARPRGSAEASGAKAPRAEAGGKQGKEGAPRFPTAREYAGKKEPSGFRSAYTKLKRFVMEREASNETKLCFIYSGGGWYKVFGNSALIFYNWVMPRTGINGSLRPDTDYTAVSAVGAVSISDMNYVHRKLLEIGMQMISRERNVVIYNTGMRFTKADLAAFSEERQLDAARMNTIVRPKNLLPEFYTSLREFTPKLYFATRRIEGGARDAIAVPTIKCAADMVCRYVEVCNGDAAELEEFADWTRRKINWMLGRVEILHDFRLIDDKTSFQLLYCLQRIRRALSKCMLREV